MAKLEFINLDLKTQNFNEISTFLGSEGVEIGKFKLTKLAKTFAEKNSLDDDERTQLIADFPELINKYSKLNGYRADVICLDPDFPYYQVILKKFSDIHYHFENEHWYLIDGFCGFSFLGSHGWKYNIEVEVGEHLTVAEGKWQWVVPPVGKRVKFLRFFNCTGKIPAPPEIYFNNTSKQEVT